MVRLPIFPDSPQLLQRPKSLGGTALENFRYYYLATNIRLLRFWRQGVSPFSPAWFIMETNSVKPVSLTALLNSLYNHQTNRILVTVWSMCPLKFGHNLGIILDSNHTLVINL